MVAREQYQLGASVAEAVKTTEFEEPASVDLSGIYFDQDGNELTFRQTGCSGDCVGLWPYTVSGNEVIVRLESSVITGSITGTQESYVIVWSSGHRFQQRSELSLWSRVRRRAIEHCGASDDELRDLGLDADYECDGKVLSVDESPSFDDGVDHAFRLPWQYASLRSLRGQSQEALLPGGDAAALEPDSPRDVQPDGSFGPSAGESEAFFGTLKDRLSVCHTLTREVTGRLSQWREAGSPWTTPHTGIQGCASEVEQLSGDEASHSDVEAPAAGTDGAWPDGTRQVSPFPLSEAALQCRRPVAASCCAGGTDVGGGGGQTHSGSEGTRYVSLREFKREAEPDLDQASMRQPSPGSETTRWRFLSWRARRESFRSEPPPSPSCSSSTRQGAVEEGSADDAAGAGTRPSCAPPEAEGCCWAPALRAPCWGGLHRLVGLYPGPSRRGGLRHKELGLAPTPATFRDMQPRGTAGDVCGAAVPEGHHVASVSTPCPKRRSRQKHSSDFSSVLHKKSL